MFYFSGDGPSTEHYLKWRAAQSQIDIAVVPFCSYVFTLLCSLFSLWAIVNISQMFLFSSGLSVSWRCVIFSLSSCKICFYLSPLYMSTHYITVVKEKIKYWTVNLLYNVFLSLLVTLTVSVFYFFSFFEQYRIRIQYLPLNHCAT